MVSKFEAVPIEKDTNIIFQIEAELDVFDVLYQKWCWDGVTAESIIFANEDIVGLSDDSKLEDEVRSSPIVNENSSMTIKRSDSGFTFVNFNFET